MARKRKQGTAEDLMDMVALLPWWAGVGLAILSYLVLRQLAAPPTIGAVQPGQMGGAVIRMVISGVAMAGQYIVPILCLFGALFSFLRRKQRAALVNTVTSSKAADALNGVSWREFELLVGEAFRLQGYMVAEQGGGGPDGGVDLSLRRGGETFLVQCKQWKAYKVGVEVVRELYGVMAAKGAAGGFVVTSGSFTTDAQEFAHGRNIKLVDGPRLTALLHQAKAARSQPGRTPASPAETRNAQVPPNSASAAYPTCPLCAATMVRRTAKKGASAGSQFWGCSKFPACRGTR